MSQKGNFQERIGKEIKPVINESTGSTFSEVIYTLTYSFYYKYRFQKFPNVPIKGTVRSGNQSSETLNVLYL